MSIFGYDIVGVVWEDFFRGLGGIGGEKVMWDIFGVEGIFVGMKIWI